MKLVRCKKCKQMYELISINNKFCPSCTKKEYDRYINVRTYVKKYPGITVRQVSEDLGINIAVIMRYLKEEKLEISGSSHAFLRCEICGVEISTGLHCQNCKRNNTGDTSTTSTSVQREVEGSGMMFTAKNKHKN